jgi:hypothetical protein
MISAAALPMNRRPGGRLGTTAGRQREARTPGKQSRRYPRTPAGVRGISGSNSGGGARFAR